MRYRITDYILPMLALLIISMATVGFAQEDRFLRNDGFPQQPQQGGPFNDEVFGAVSNDGLIFKVLDGPFFKHASVPDVLELTQDGVAGNAGTLVLYFVDFSEVKGPGSEGISMASSSDGINWSTKQTVNIEGKVNKGAAVDPSVVQLADGRIRMFFFGSEITKGDPAKASGDHKIYSAISDDGINFQVEPRVCFQASFITDPEVLLAGDEWLMFLSKGQETLLARSNDGLKFTLDRNFDLTIGGVPGAVCLPDGRVRVFATGRGGIVSALYKVGSNQPPVTEAGARISLRDADIVADPSCIRRLDGSYYLIFKKKGVGDVPFRDTPF